MKRFVAGGWDRCEVVVNGWTFRAGSHFAKDELYDGTSWGNTCVTYGDRKVCSIGDGKRFIGTVYVHDGDGWTVAWMGNKMFSDNGHALKNAMAWCDRH